MKPSARVGLVPMVLLALAGCDCPEPEPDPYAARVQADVEACRLALEELAECGPAPDCRPSIDPEASPLSLRVLANCAASVCAGLGGEEADQCRFDVMVNPGPSCSEARALCEAGDDEASWLALP